MHKESTIDLLNIKRLSLLKIYVSLKSCRPILESPVVLVHPKL